MWIQIVCAFVGIWLTVSPWYLGFNGRAAASALITGPIIASIGIIAISEVTRGMRRINQAMALWLLIQPWVFGITIADKVNSIVTGLILLVFAGMRGAIREQTGGGWRMLFR